MNDLREHKEHFQVGENWSCSTSTAGLLKYSGSDFQNIGPTEAKAQEPNV